MAEETKWLARSCVIGLLSVLLGILGLLLKSSPETFKSNIELFTLVVGVVTLVVVCYQVFIAREELAKVSEDVERNRKLFEKASREITLFLTFDSLSFEDVPMPDKDGDYCYFGYLGFRVQNSGNRVAATYLISLGIPLPYVQSQLSEESWTLNGGSVADPNGGPQPFLYEYYTRLVKYGTTFPNSATAHVVFLKYEQNQKCPELPFLYSITHEDGSTPTREHFYSEIGKEPQLYNEQYIQIFKRANSTTFNVPVGLGDVSSYGPLDIQAKRVIRNRNLRDSSTSEPAEK